MNTLQIYNAARAAWDTARTICTAPAWDSLEPDARGVWVAKFKREIERDTVQEIAPTIAARPCLSETESLCLVAMRGSAQNVKALDVARMVAPLVDKGLVMQDARGVYHLTAQGQGAAFAIVAFDNAKRGAN